MILKIETESLWLSDMRMIPSAIASAANVSNSACEFETKLYQRIEWNKSHEDSCLQNYLNSDN